VSEPSWQHEAEHDQTLEGNWLFQLRRERFRSRVSAKAHDFYVVHLADAVNVLALTPEQRLVMVRQFRAGSGTDTLETPGGLLEPGEDPLEAGARELLEETGYVGEMPRLLGTVWANPSLLTSRSTTILITGARPLAAPRLDPSEELSVELVEVDSLPALVRDGKIDHGLVVLGLLWWLCFEPS
jgi:8-oxo-dGTP pyrophosphatase MutT (NUDIX family)